MSLASDESCHCDEHGQNLHSNRSKPCSPSNPINPCRPSNHRDFDSLSVAARDALIALSAATDSHPYRFLNTRPLQPVELSDPAPEGGLKQRKKMMTLMTVTKITGDPNVPAGSYLSHSLYLYIYIYVLIILSGLQLCNAYEILRYVYQIYACVYM